MMQLPVKLLFGVTEPTPPWLPHRGSWLPRKGQPERATQCVRMLLSSLRHPLSQPDGCQLSQRESQGVLPYPPAKLQFTWFKIGGMNFLTEYTIFTNLFQ